jgi:fructose-bisphosphate aldolase class II
MVFTGAVRRYLSLPENKSEFDPRKFLLEATKGMQAICKARYEAFGSAGQAGKIKPISTDQMAERYRKGELAAIVRT